MQHAGEQRLVKSGHLQSLSLFIVPHNQHPLSVHALPQHLRLAVIRHLDAEHQAVLDTMVIGGRGDEKRTFNFPLNVYIRDRYRRSRMYLPDIQVGGRGLACVIMLLLKQIAQTDVEGSFDVSDGEAVVRPFPTSLHVTDDWNHSPKLCSQPRYF